MDVCAHYLAQCFTSYYFNVAGWSVKTWKSRVLLHRKEIQVPGDAFFMCASTSCIKQCRGDQISFSHQMLYHIMTLLKSCTDKSFEIVIDLTQATQINEPDVSSLALLYVRTYDTCFPFVNIHTLPELPIAVGIAGKVCCLCS